MKPEYWERAKRALRKDPVMAAIMGRAVQQDVRLSPRLSPGGCGHAL